MTFCLSNGSNPNDLEVKTSPENIISGVQIGDYHLSMVDFCAMVRYVMTNTNVTGDEDPRVQLLADLHKSQMVGGYNGDSQRIKLPDMKY